MLFGCLLSIGEPGVGCGALRAARQVGFKHGGLIPRDCQATDGELTLDFADMNVAQSAATLILTWRNRACGEVERMVAVCERIGKPYWIEDLANLKETDRGLEVVYWIESLDVEGDRLNVVGPLESQVAGIEAAACQYMERVLRGVLIVSRAYDKVRYDHKPMILFTPAFQFFTDIIYWDVVAKALSEEYGEKIADDMINAFLYDRKDRVEYVCDASDGKWQDILRIMFSFAIPESVYTKIVEGVKRYHFADIGDWSDGGLEIRLKCMSHEVTHDMKSYQKIHFEGEPATAGYYHPEKDECSYFDV